MPAANSPTKVFISYSHDSPEHMNRVLDLSNRLRIEGVDCDIDQYEESPEEGWPRWTQNRIKWADYVLVICTETYLRRFSGEEEKGKGLGVKWEGAILTQELYDAESMNRRFVPVIFSKEDEPHIPITLRGATRYVLSDPDADAAMYRRLTGQPLVRKPELGQVVDLPLTVSVPPLPVKGRKQDFLKLSNLPLPRNPYFTGRDDKLQLLQKGFNPSRRSEVPVTQAITGMGGVGKTQLALEYAYLNQDEYRALLWALADSRDSLVSGFAELAKVLNLPEKDAKDQSEAVTAVQRWLAREEGWLLIFDNAEDLKLVKEFIPTKGKGQVLITTQAEFLGTLAASVAIEDLSESEGALLLLRHLNFVGVDGTLEDAPAEKREQAKEFVRELGGLPLALEQAASFIGEMGFGFSEYIHLYRSEGEKLRVGWSEQTPNQHVPVAITVFLSFSKLTKRSEAAADLLRVCAFLSPDAIPEEIFIKGGAELGEALSRAVEGQFGLLETVKVARQYSLLKRNAEEGTLRIHRTVQAALMDMMDEPTKQLWAERAVRAVNRVFPEIEYENWESCERLVPQVLVLKKSIDRWDVETAESGRILDQTGWYLTERRAAYEEAMPLFQYSLEIREKALGAEHPDVALSLNNLATLYNQQGKYADAEPLFKRALEINEKALGAEHPNVALSLNNLAALYDDQGKYADAEPLYKRALEIREKSLGAEHPHVAESLNNLATLYYHQGKLGKAEPLYKRAIKINEVALGKSHPDLAKILFSLGNNYATQKRYKEAEPLQRRGLKLLEKSLGEEHPDTLRALENFYDYLRSIGKKREAREIMDRVKTIKIRLSHQKL